MEFESIPSLSTEGGLGFDLWSWRRWDLIRVLLRGDKRSVDLLTLTICAAPSSRLSHSTPGIYSWTNQSFLPAAALSLSLFEDGFNGLESLLWLRSLRILLSVQPTLPSLPTTTTEYDVVAETLRAPRPKDLSLVFFSAPLSMYWFRFRSSLPAIVMMTRTGSFFSH